VIVEKDSGTARIEASLAAASTAGRTALLPFVVGGRPGRERFREMLREVACRADVVEVGLPFSDPVADGPVIAEASRLALAEGVHLDHVLDAVANLDVETPIVLFSYANPLFSIGLGTVCRRLAETRVAGLVVPDLPFDTPEGVELSERADQHGLAWIQLVTPLTAPERRARLLAASRGFVYAVLRAGITGGRTEVDDERDPGQFLEELRSTSPLPVCAGFGLRDAAQVRALRTHADGLIVGTALVERIERGGSPAPYLDELLEAARHTTP